MQVFLFHKASSSPGYDISGAFTSAAGSLYNGAASTASTIAKGASGYAAYGRDAVTGTVSTVAKGVVGTGAAVYNNLPSLTPTPEEKPKGFFKKKSKSFKDHVSAINNIAVLHDEREGYVTRGKALVDLPNYMHLMKAPMRMLVNGRRFLNKLSDGFKRFTSFLGFKRSNKSEKKIIEIRKGDLIKLY